MSERREQPEAAQALYEADPYEYGDARKLMEELELAEPIAITLVRRGHRTPERARSFLEAAERHDPGLFRGIDDAVGLITLALDAGSRITVHGDYDVDGISATAILVSALRRAGGECDWLIPDRTADGYGLSPQTVEGLAERGTELLITADCGITSVEEVALATELGLEVIVTDHHRPGEQLPACPIVHPEVSEYPFDGLCGAAVAHKLVERLEDSLATAGGAVERAGNDLDLVALATVADMVPLVDENRTLAREGIAELRRARRPGIRALLEVSGVEPEHLDEGDIAFRVAPRINAAGRLYRADAGVELMLTADGERAAEIAKELDAANGERRTVEREVSNGANAALRELPEELREAPGLVLAGEGWHPGVVGIAASRIVERHGRPAVLLSIEGDRAKGSGRSVPGFDLLAALAECSPLLDRYGGHRAAAGVELDAARVDDFREAFAKAAAVQLPAGSAETAERIDAVVGAEALDHDLAEQLGTLGPFGQGNPEVRLLVPWARVGDVRTMGEEGRHARFSVSSGPAKAAGVAFNANGALSRAQEVPSDLTVRLELNRWNGAVEPRAVLQSSR
ncbi:MAG TPA: single-stranded-DNA-specific exonuclease RecJ, partial [Solirubrobacterales bacterium]|nr:single-stranded-DNA-specific exonuclease RecJ [Solirubrobacterales bacterium]